MLSILLLGAHCAARARLHRVFAGVPSESQIAHSSRNYLRLKFEARHQLRDPPQASRALLRRLARIYRDRIESTQSRIGFCSYFRFHTGASSIPPTPYFRFADPYPTPAPSLPKRMAAGSGQFGTGHQHSSPRAQAATGVLPAPCAAAVWHRFSATLLHLASLRPQWSLCALLPAPVAEGPAAGRPSIRCSIWVLYLGAEGRAFFA